MAAKKKETKGLAVSKRLIIPSLTVFVTSFCIMVLELVAARLIARSLGSSLYTWTSVIGVVLAGITLGNYTGGRIADRFPAAKALGWLFAICSVTCVAIIVSNNVVGSCRWLWKLGWPMRVFTHVCLVFLLPSALLGTISPVVAKMALDRGLPTGKTVGDIYAWAAAGSIAGTFTAGYYLIAQIGTIAIIWAIAGVLLLLAILYCLRLRVLYVWGVVFGCLLIMGAAPWHWARAAGAGLRLRKPPSETIIYEDETSYCYVAVEQLSSAPDRRAFMQDKLKHSEMIMNDVLDLQYFYTHVFAAITHGLSTDKNKLSVLALGGGGYVYPRYVEKVWPGSRIDVVEIDPGVTEAAIQAFGLDRDSSIKTFTMDARNYVDTLLERESKSGLKTRYDFIYGDALNDYSVPFQLTTREFNDKIANLLTDDGVYMVELIDSLHSGLFLGAMVNTMEKTFPYVYVITRGDLADASRNTFVAVAAKRELDVAVLCARYKKKSHSLWHLGESDMQRLKEKAAGLVLTDDYAPVESLLSPVVRADAANFLSSEYFKEAKQLFEQGKFDDCVRKYRRIIEISPITSVRMYNEIGMVFSKQHKWSDAVEAFENALAYIARQKLKLNTANLRYNLAMALRMADRTDQAKEQFKMAVEDFRKELQANPQSAQTHALLAKCLAALGSFDEAGLHFLVALNLNPLNVGTHLELVRNLEVQGKLEKAIEHLRAAIVFMQGRGKKEEAAKLHKQLQVLQSKQSQKD